MTFLSSNSRGRIALAVASSYHKQLSEQTMSNTSNVYEVPHIQELQAPVPSSVKRMTDGLVREWTQTMELCIKRAIELEDAASDLRDRAEKLRQGIETLPDEINGCVTFEINSRNRVAALALVNPSE
jgi:hypothetical protein